MRKRILILALFTTPLLWRGDGGEVFSQNKIIDSLLLLIRADNPDTSKLNHLNKLIEEYNNIGLFDSSIYYCDKSLQLSQKLNFKKGIASAYELTGNVCDYKGNYPRALDYYFKALKLDEVQKDKKAIAMCLGNIGIVYYEERDYPKALDYYNRALKMDEDLGNKYGVVLHLTNMGILYSEQSNYQKALDYFFRGLKMDKELEDKEGIASDLGNIGGVYRTQKDYPNALDYLFKALKMDEELGNKNGIARHLGNIGGLYTVTGKFKEAEKFLKSAIAIDDSIGAIDNLMQFEESLSQLYDTIGRHKEALIHYKKAMALKDTIFSQENKKQLVRKELNYEFDKKETAIKAEQDKKDAVTSANKKRQQIVLLLVSCVLLFVFVFAGFVVRSLRVTRKQKHIIELQKNEVSRQKDVAEIQKEEAEKQKELVQEKQKEIVASITYAKRIQTALLTSDEYINNHLPAEHFILFKPKDIVSGDFYWALSIATLPGWDMGTNKIKLLPENKRKNTFYMVTADCTGHGVPGAFMSMLNISYLNENIIERGIRLPHDILNSQRKEIIEALNPIGSTEECKDGMDCALCVYDFDKMLLHFAAANNPLWLVRNNELKEYKADKMPVGKYSEKMQPFILQTIELQKGDIIYTSTDGFADQFGTNGKKLMKKKFKEELLKIHQLPMKEQKEYLNNFFENWKGSKEQVDDVTVIGIRI